MSTQSIRDVIKQELPVLIRSDREIQELVLELAKGRFADRGQTEDRFEQLLREAQQDREENRQEFDRVHEKLQRDREEQRQRWEEQGQRWEENKREFDRVHEELQRDREENKREFDRVHEEIMASAQKYESGIGALGARWGIQTEQAFRNGLAAILENSFGVDVVNVTEYDEDGEVFGRPDQIELDVIVKNGVLIICEIKSSMGKADMYVFERKARFYEKMHNRKADRLIVISSFVDPLAEKVAEKLGVETFSH